MRTRVRALLQKMLANLVIKVKWPVWGPGELWDMCISATLRTVCVLRGRGPRLISMEGSQVREAVSRSQSVQM